MTCAHNLASMHTLFLHALAYILTLLGHIREIIELTGSGGYITFLEHIS